MGDGSYIAVADNAQLDKLGLSSEELAKGLGAKEATILKKLTANLKANKGNTDILLAAYDKLNDRGQAVAIERVEELAKIPEYKKEQPPAADSDET